MSRDAAVIKRFHDALVDEIRRSAPEYLTRPFTVAEIYQSLVPYRTHRDRIGVELNGDYEAALLRLLGGELELMELESDAARTRIRRELDSSNPNTGVYREFAAVNVRLNPDALDDVEVADEATAEGEEADEKADEEAGDRPTASSGKGKGVAVAAPAPRPGPAAGNGRDSSAEMVRGRPPSDCPECDGDLPGRDTLRFCPFCGANVFIMPCGECGEVLERNWTFCIACGAPTDD